MRKIDRFTASRLSVYVQKLSRVFAIYVYMSYMSCSMYAAVILCMCKFQCADDRVVIASLFDCVWAQHVSKALLLLCWCWWDCSALLTSIACRKFIVKHLVQINFVVNWSAWERFLQIMWNRWVAHFWMKWVSVKHDIQWW